MMDIDTKRRHADLRFAVFWWNAPIASWQLHHTGSKEKCIESFKRAVSKGSESTEFRLFELSETYI